MAPRAGEDQPMNGIDVTVDSLGLVPVVSQQQQEEKPEYVPTQIVWKNVILMAVLHLGALYGVWLIPQAKISTLIFGKYLQFTKTFIF